MNKFTSSQRIVPRYIHTSDIYLFTREETKLINVLFAIKEKQKSLQCGPLSWHSIKIVWMSAFRSMHDLCLKNLINIAANNLAENAVREIIC